MNITNSLIIFAFSLVINICLTKKDIPYKHALGLFFLDSKIVISITLFLKTLML